MPRSLRRIILTAGCWLLAGAWTSDWHEATGVQAQTQAQTQAQDAGGQAASAESQDPRGPRVAGRAGSDLNKRIEALLQQLDADRFADRQSAQAELLELGEAALPQLWQVPPGVSRERQLRQRMIGVSIQRAVLLEGFQKLSTRTEAEIDLVEAMWLISKIVDPTVRREPLVAELDRLAKQVRDRLGTHVDPASAAPQTVVDAMRQVLFQDFGLAGSQGNYDHPDSSSLHVALTRRRGLPILLSHILVAVADRLGVPLVGLQVPGRYMVKYDGSRAPPGFERQDILIDPFGGGQVVRLEELRQRIPGLDPDQHLAASSKRATVVRMLRNLSSDYVVIGEIDQANQVLRYLELVDTGTNEAP